jgi:hypothetical protein
MKDDFQKRVIIAFLDFQLFVLISILLSVIGIAFINDDFFMNNGFKIRLIFYFIYYIYFDFKLKKTLVMRIFKYNLIIPDNIDLLTKFKYEILNFIDIFLFPIHMILSIFSDKKNRLLLREKYTKIRMIKLAD